MLESLKDTLVTWQAKNDDRIKLQHVYIILAVSLLLVAGVIGLINRELGQNVLTIAIVSAVMFLLNAVVWALLQSALLSRLPARRSTPRKK
jgi:drug/metabolite transporter (DMT)-like permease